jgi:OHCU decarboxylase
VRAQPSDYELVCPGNLAGVLSLLAEEPGTWLPIAGGTDLMVQYSAGHLGARKLVSIWNLPELRCMEGFPSEIRIGAACTYTDLLQHDVVSREFPLLVSAARCTGGVANQNRGTIGGNIANASPAADSLPALLVYEAELILVSVRGERRVSYASFHTGYRATQCAQDEVIRCVCLPRKFLDYHAHSRKVGARNAQAISKVCLAALARSKHEVIDDIRMAMGSVAPVPLRLYESEKIIRGRKIDADLIRTAKKAVAEEIRVIDDIRSTARYRAAVAGNLVAEFLMSLRDTDDAGASGALLRWNSLPPEQAMSDILPCCGSKTWAREMTARRPIRSEAALFAASAEAWKNLSEADWIEAFASHPRIGESRVPPSAAPRSAAWSGDEQQKAGATNENVMSALAEGNRAYEQRFGRIFIVCATGKSAETIVEILQRRLLNDESREMQESAEAQRQITRLRLKKWLTT